MMKRRRVRQTHPVAGITAAAWEEAGKRKNGQYYLDYAARLRDMEKEVLVNRLAQLNIKKEAKPKNMNTQTPCPEKQAQIDQKKRISLARSKFDGVNLKSTHSCAMHELEGLSGHDRTTALDFLAYMIVHGYRCIVSMVDVKAHNTKAEEILKIIDDRELGTYTVGEWAWNWQYGTKYNPHLVRGIWLNLKKDMREQYHMNMNYYKDSWPELHESIQLVRLCNKNKMSWQN